MPSSTYPGVYIEEIPFGSHPIEGVSTSTTGFVGLTGQGPNHQPTHVASFADFTKIFGGLQPATELGYAVLQYFVNGGQEAWIVRVNDPSEIPHALSAYDTVESISMLCVPGVSDEAVLKAALTYCDNKRIFLIVDAPSSDTQATEKLAATLQAEGTSNAALYFPPLTAMDPFDPTTPRQTAPSGAVAGVIARTDLTRGVWVAPAGPSAQLHGVLGLTVNVDQPNAQTLAESGISALRTTTPGGTVVWTARTVSGSDPWKYVPVRRLALYIERSLIRGLQWAVFEPNDEPLWVELATTVASFLMGLWKAGAFKGSTVGEAYFVKCGRDVMTQADLDSGKVVILIGFAPMHPAEWVMVRIGVWQKGRP